MADPTFEHLDGSPQKTTETTEERELTWGDVWNEAGPHTGRFWKSLETEASAPLHTLFL